MGARPAELAVAGASSLARVSSAAPAAAARTGAADSAAARAAEEPAPLIVPGRSLAGPDTSKAARAKHAREQYQLGVALEREGAAAAAIAAYDIALRFDPSLPQAHFRMGKLFLTRDEFREAAHHFVAELKAHPDNVPADRELGLTLARMGDSTHAVARLERLARLHPLEGENWRALGFAYSAAGRLKQAEAALRQAIALKPPRAAEHRDLGVLLASLGREKEARTQYQRAIALDAQDAAVWLNLGNLERRSGRLPQALQSYTAAEARDSNFALAIQGQIGVLLQLDRASEAGVTYRRWLKVKPDDHNARLEAVRHFNGTGRPDVALEVAREGVRRDPRSADARVILAIANEYAGETRVALEELRSAQSLFHDATGKARVEDLIAAMRGSAPDSLRTMFAADSVTQARADSVKATGSPGPRGKP